MWKGKKKSVAFSPLNFPNSSLTMIFYVHVGHQAVNLTETLLPLRLTWDHLLLTIVYCTCLWFFYLLLYSLCHIFYQHFFFFLHLYTSWSILHSLLAIFPCHVYLISFFTLKFPMDGDMGGLKMVVKIARLFFVIDCCLVFGLKGPSPAATQFPVQLLVLLCNWGQMTIFIWLHYKRYLQEVQATLKSPLKWGYLKDPYRKCAFFVSYDYKRPIQEVQALKSEATLCIYALLQKFTFHYSDGAILDTILNCTAWAVPHAIVWLVAVQI